MLSKSFRPFRALRTALSEPLARASSPAYFDGRIFLINSAGIGQQTRWFSEKDGAKDEDQLGPTQEPSKKMDSDENGKFATGGDNNAPQVRDDAFRDTLPVLEKIKANLFSFFDFPWHFQTNFSLSLSLSLPISLSLYLSHYLSIYMSVCLSLSLSFFLSLCPHILA